MGVDCYTELTSQPSLTAEGPDSSLPRHFVRVIFAPAPRHPMTALTFTTAQQSPREADSSRSRIFFATFAPAPRQTALTTAPEVGGDHVLVRGREHDYHNPRTTPRPSAATVARPSRLMVGGLSADYDSSWSERASQPLLTTTAQQEEDPISHPRISFATFAPADVDRPLTAGFGPTASLSLIPPALLSYSYGPGTHETPILAHAAAETPTESSPADSSPSSADDSGGFNLHLQFWNKVVTGTDCILLKFVLNFQWRGGGGWLCGNYKGQGKGKGNYVSLDICTVSESRTGA